MDGPGHDDAYDFIQGMDVAINWNRCRLIFGLARRSSLGPPGIGEILLLVVEEVQGLRCDQLRIRDWSPSSVSPVWAMTICGSKRQFKLASVVFLVCRRLPHRRVSSRRVRCRRRRPRSGFPYFRRVNDQAFAGQASSLRPQNCWSLVITLTAAGDRDASPPYSNRIFRVTRSGQRAGQGRNQQNESTQQSTRVEIFNVSSPREMWVSMRVALTTKRSARRTEARPF